MNATFLSATNSWHWLGAALAVSGAISAALWRSEARHLATEHAPEWTRQARHLEDLRMLDPSQAETLDRQTDALNERLKALKAEVAAAGFAPIPTGNAAVLETKHALDQTLTRHHLRIVDSAVSVAVEAPVRRGEPRTAQKATLPPSAAAYERQVRQMAAAIDPAMRADFLRDAERKIAQLKAAEARRAKTAQTTAKPQAPAVAPRASAKPPFKTESVAYAVEGDFRDMFRFLVEESFRKPAYHLCGFSVAKAPDKTGGPMRMTFTLQINTR